MRVAFVGLGIMGKPMARNLLNAGHELFVYDIVSAPLEELVAAGAARGESAAEVAARAEVAVTMLPDGPEVETAVLGAGGVLEGAVPGSILIDMSSISPLVSQKVGAACARRGMEFLDAPVSGGEPKAIDGTLAIMVGGKREIFDKVLPLLQAMGSSATLAGPVGAGNVTKLANQIMVACNIAAMGEAQGAGPGHARPPRRTCAAMPKWSEGYSVGSPTAARSNVRRADSTSIPPRIQM